MPISYSSEGYKVTPQLANLGALQALQPLDVTRRASFEPRALTPINIPAPPPMIIPPSSRPELVTEGISKGLLAAIGGITEGVTAKYKGDRELAAEGRKYAHEKELMTIRASAKDDTLERQKALIDYRATKERLKGSLGDNYPIYLDGQTGEVKQDSESDVIDGDVGGDVSDSATQIDFDTPLPELGSESDSLGAISPAQAIQERVAAQAKGLENLSPEYISASTSGANVAPEVPTEFSLSGIKTSFVPPEQLAEAKQVRGELRKTLAGLEAPKPVKQTQIEPQRPGFYPIEKAQEEASREIPGWKPAEIDEKTVKTVGGQTFFLVKPRKALSPKELAEEKAAVSAPILSKDQITVYDKLASNVQQNPLIKNAIDAKSSHEIVNTSLAEGTGFGDISAINAFQRMVDPGVAVREGDVTLLQTAIPRLKRLGLTVENLVVGDRLTPEARKQIKNLASNLAKTRVESAKDSISDLRETAKDAGINPDRVIRELKIQVPKEEAQKNEISSLSMDLEQTPVDQRQSPEFLAKRKALYELIKQEELKKKKPTPVTPVSQPIQQPIFQPATPRSTGETLESFIGNK